MGRPRQHDDATREALLLAAEDLLARGESLSVRAVADATSTTTRAVYSVFGSMEGLHDALIIRAFRDIETRVNAAPITNDPIADLIGSGILGFRAFAIARPNLFRIAFERLGPRREPSPEAQAVATAALRSLGTRLARCKEAGLLGTRRVRDVVWQVHALCQGLASVELHGWLGDDPEQHWREALGTFVAGLALPAPRTRRRSS